MKSKTREEIIEIIDRNFDIVGVNRNGETTFKFQKQPAIDELEALIEREREEIFEDFMKWREAKLYEWCGKSEVDVIMHDYEKLFKDYLQSIKKEGGE